MRLACERAMLETGEMDVLQKGKGKAQKQRWAKQERKDSRKNQEVSRAGVCSLSVNTITVHCKCRRTRNAVLAPPSVCLCFTRLPASRASVYCPLTRMFLPSAVTQIQAGSGATLKLPSFQSMSRINLFSHTVSGLREFVTATPNDKIKGFQVICKKYCFSQLCLGWG